MEISKFLRSLRAIKSLIDNMLLCYSWKKMKQWNSFLLIVSTITLINFLLEEKYNTLLSVFPVIREDSSYSLSRLHKQNLKSDNKIKIQENNSNKLEMRNQWCLPHSPTGTCPCPLNSHSRDNILLTKKISKIITATVVCQDNSNLDLIKEVCLISSVCLTEIQWWIGHIIKIRVNNLDHRVCKHMEWINNLNNKCWLTNS